MTFQLGEGGSAMHYLPIGRYNAQGSAGVLKDGLTSRKAVIKEFTERVGGKLIGFWGVESADHDFVIVSEGDTGPAQWAANSLGQRSMGHLEELRVYTLVESEDVDAAVEWSCGVTGSRPSPTSRTGSAIRSGVEGSLCVGWTRSRCHEATIAPPGRPSPRVAVKCANRGVHVLSVGAVLGITCVTGGRGTSGRRSAFRGERGTSPDDFGERPAKEAL
jgi:hypothetical protein